MMMSSFSKYSIFSIFLATSSPKNHAAPVKKFNISW